MYVTSCIHIYVYVQSSRSRTTSFNQSRSSYLLLTRLLPAIVAENEPQDTFCNVCRIFWSEKSLILFNKFYELDNYTFFFLE